MNKKDVPDWIAKDKKMYNLLVEDSVDRMLKRNEEYLRRKKDREEIIDLIGYFVCAFFCGVLLFWGITDGNCSVGERVGNDVIYKHPSSEIGIKK